MDNENAAEDTTKAVLDSYARSIGVPPSETAKAYFDCLLTPDNQQEVFVMRPDL